MRDVGAGTGWEAAAGTEAGCTGAAVIGPDGACASAISTVSSPSAANPVKTPNLKK